MLVSLISSGPLLPPSDGAHVALSDVAWSSLSPSPPLFLSLSLSPPSLPPCLPQPVDPKTARGNTPLMFAAGGGHVDCGIVLIRA
eukprot:1149321-Rhodomonas_salina.2